ncbi:MAG: ATP-binding protein, partial [Candidatus Gastranaerophilales bacterium]|nr:ATP-binding protein [Candidatus Gastranaerophilales bacterium]
DLYMIITNESQSIKLEKIIKDAFIFFIILITGCFILISLLANGISKPLLKMNETVSKIGTGDLSGRLEYTKYDEINQLVQSYNTMVNSLQKIYSSLEMQVQDRTKELKNAYAELQNTQAMMVHSEKMKSLGELVAGIMHEINNPINFIYGNMTHLSNYSNDLIQIIEEYTKYNDSLKPEQKEDIDKLKEDIDYEFLKSDMPDLIKSCKEGADRAKNIIQDLKSFSRMEEATIVDVDIPHEIDTTLNILYNKLKNKAEIHKEYQENLPKIEAFGGQLNQVFMNILDNAAGAIKNKGDIWIRLNTDKSKTKLIIQFEDNGVGMDEETARKVFDPFFTTKPVGQGTGLGMSITHKIIKNHQGDIRIQSQPGLGTTFIITLPINIDRENLNANLVSGETNG